MTTRSHQVSQCRICASARQWQPINDAGVTFQHRIWRAPVRQGARSDGQTGRRFGEAGVTTIKAYESLMFSTAFKVISAVPQRSIGPGDAQQKHRVHNFDHAHTG